MNQLSNDREILRNVDESGKEKNQKFGKDIVFEITLERTEERHLWQNNIRKHKMFITNYSTFSNSSLYYTTFDMCATRKSQQLELR